MEQFNLEKYLENPSRKVVTRDGREVDIVKYDMKGTHFPILYVISNEDGSQEPCYCSKSGMCQFDNTQSSTDLFFADEKLTEFEKGLVDLVSGWCDSHIETPEEYINKHSQALLDLARKEVEKEITKEVEQKAINHTYAYQNGYENGKYDALKDLPKWKKIPAGTSRKDLFDMMHKHIVLAFNDCVDYYYIDESDLRKLPKEE